MRCTSLLTSLVLALGTAANAATSWNLVWSDEFDGTGLPDASKWSYDVGGGGWGNSESQFYTGERTENARQEGGNLVITARRETWENRSYTSARLVTRGKGDWLYGRVEVRALLPKGRGMWPAIWMLPTDWAYGDWPKSGELDLMENVGYDPDRIHSNIHTQAYNHSIGTNKGNNRLVSAPSENWHVYRLDWYPDRVEYYIDGEVLFTFRNEGTGSAAWPFDKRFHLILNIAVGGSWGGTQGIDDAIFPQAMKVDWVRVYQQDSSFVPPTPGTDLLVNGDFAAGATGWNGPNYQGTGAGTGGITGGAMSAGITTPGSERWNVQLLQSGLVLEQGRTYTLSLRAKASTGKSIDVSLEHDGTPWTSYSRRLLPLTTEMTSHSWTFRMDSATDRLARVSFNLGLEAGDVTLDDVRLVVDAPPVGIASRTSLRSPSGPVEIYAPDGTRVAGFALGPNGDLQGAIRRRVGAGMWIVRQGEQAFRVALPSSP